MLLLTAFFLSGSHLKWDCFVFRGVASDSIDFSQMPFRRSSVGLTCLWVSPLTRFCLAVEVLCLKLLHPVGESISRALENRCCLELKWLSLEGEVGEGWEGISLGILNSIFSRGGTCFAA